MTLETLQEEAGKLAQITETLSRIEASYDWQMLKSSVLDGLVSRLERQLYNVANEKEVNLPELYRLQGQLMWAKKYADLKKLADNYRLQVENIKLQIKHEQTNPRDGAL